MLVLIQHEELVLCGDKSCANSHQLFPVGDQAINFNELKPLEATVQWQGVPSLLLDPWAFWCSQVIVEASLGPEKPSQGMIQYLTLNIPNAYEL